MNCAELDILFCDYVDGTLKPAEKAQVEAHLAQCPACAELVRDAQAAVSFLERVADVEPPRELMTRLAFSAPPAATQARRLRRRYFRWLEPVLQPRVVMGMAMTILSFSMLGRFVNIPVRQLQPKDLNPVEVWAVLDGRMHRLWERGVKYYESMRLFVEIKSRYREIAGRDEEWKAQPGAASREEAAPVGSLSAESAGEHIQYTPGRPK
jgi:hypothetical protein